MKVVFLTTIPSPYRVDFFNEWGKYCQLTVIFELQASSKRDGNWKNFSINNFKPIFLNGYQCNANKAFCPSVINEIKKLEYDAFIIGGYNTPTAIVTIEYLRRKKIPFIINADGGYIKKDNFLLRGIKRHFISSASMWICPSEITKDYFIHYGAQERLIQKYPFSSIHNSSILKSPLSDEKKKELRKILNIKEEKIILSVGQFIYRKGFDLLLRAKANLDPQIGLYIIGGTETEEYRSIIKTLNLRNVHFLPFLESDVLSQYYKSANVFAFPTREDIWGLVINEAASYGLPIVTTNKCIAGLEIIKNGKNGYLFPAEDVTTLSNRLNEILFNQDLSTLFSKNLLEVATKYTIEEMAQVHTKIIREFMGIYGSVK